MFLGRNLAGIPDLGVFLGRNLAGILDLGVLLRRNALESRITGLFPSRNTAESLNLAVSEAGKCPRSRFLSAFCNPYGVLPLPLGKKENK